MNECAMQRQVRVSDRYFGSHQQCEPFNRVYEMQLMINAALDFFDTM